MRGRLAGVSCRPVLSHRNQHVQHSITRLPAKRCLQRLWQRLIVFREEVGVCPAACCPDATFQQPWAGCSSAARLQTEGYQLQQAAGQPLDGAGAAANAAREQHCPWRQRHLARAPVWECIRSHAHKPMPQCQFLCSITILSGREEIAVVYWRGQVDVRVYS